MSGGYPKIYSMKGGKREGAGRPIAPPSAVVRIRLPLPLHQQMHELGGEKWAKRVLIDALDTIKIKANDQLPGSQTSRSA